VIDEASDAVMTSERNGIDPLSQFTTFKWRA
jgi:hypothetical protein